MFGVRRAAAHQDSLRRTANDRVAGGWICGYLGVYQENAAGPVQSDRLSGRTDFCDHHEIGQASSAALAADDGGARPIGEGSHGGACVVIRHGDECSGSFPKNAPAHEGRRIALKSRSTRWAEILLAKPPTPACRKTCVVGARPAWT